MARFGRLSWWLSRMQAARASRRVAMRARGVGAVRAPWRLEAEQVFAGDKDGFDSLPDRGEVDAVVGLVLAGWSDDRGAEFGDGVSELAAGVAFVADDGFAAVEAAGQQRQRDL